MQYEKFKRDFIIRTKENLLKITEQNGYEVTQLINSSIGLLIVPEQKFYNEIDNSFVNEATLNEINLCIDSKNKMSLKEIVRHLRNSISHSRIKFENDNGKISKILFEDRVENTTTFYAKIGVELYEKFVLEFSNNIVKKLCNTEVK